MTETWIAPDFLFDGEHMHRWQAVRVSDGIIAEIGAATGQAVPLIGCLTPGFVDLQVNGGGGVLVNSDPTPEGLRKIAKAHRGFGTTAILPTVISDRPEVMARAVDAVLAVQGEAGLLGLHMEGPHLAQARRGTHAAEHLRPFDGRTLAAVERLRAAGVAVMITLAPEAASADEIGALTALGAIVSIGHTDATAEDVEATIAAGATCATHLFNAMSPLTSRAPGAVGAILNSNLFAGLICDGHHVDPRTIGIALRARRRPGRMYLVSDAMPTVGGPDAFDLYGQKLQVQDGKLINRDGNLAGAHLTQAGGLANLVQHVGVPLAQALPMVTTIPAQVIGQPGLARLIGKPVEDVMVVDDLGQFAGTLAASLA